MKLVLSEKKITGLAIVFIAIIAGAISYLVLSKKQSLGTSNQEFCTAIKVKINDEQLKKSKLRLVGLKEIEKMVQDCGVLKQEMSKIITGGIEEQLISKGLFNTVEVYKINETLSVDVSLKTPFFLVQPEKGQAYYVTRERKQLSEQDTTVFNIDEDKHRAIKADNIIPFKLAYTPVQVPVISGAISKNYAITQIYDLLTTLENNKYYKNYFGHIYMDKVEGLILRPNSCNTDIIFGYASNWEEMLHKLRIFEEEVIKRQSWEAFKYLKFNFHNQIIAQKRK